MANVKISDLTAAAAATSTQQFEVNDSAASKSVTGAQIKTFVKDGLVASDITDLTATAAELNILDGVTATTAELNILDGVTATTAEINILDGVTATAAEINKLDGLTATTAELNFVDGVTSAIQTQLNAKAALASPALTGTPTAPTAAAATDTTQIATTAFVRDAIPNVLNASGSAPLYGCRAWVNFNGTGTVAIRASGNVSSITDNGAGDYTVNFTTALPDANYCTQCTTYPKTTANNINYAIGLHTTNLAGAPTTKTTSAVRIFMSASNISAGFDMADVNVAIFR